MKNLERTWVLPRQISKFPHQWLGLSRGKRWLLVSFSYVLGVVGLWLFFPPTHNGATMFLPIVCACWLFRYHGLLISMLLNGVAFQATYYLLLRGLLPDSAYIEGGIIGFITSLLIGLIVCWLRASVDTVQVARQQVMETEHARLLIELREQQVALAYEHERKINALKEQFLLNVGHELHTPLAVLAGFLDLLVVYHEKIELETRMDILKKAQSSQQELVTLVEQVLDATKVISDIPQMKPEQVHLHDLLVQIIAPLASGLLANYTLCLQVDEQVTVWADPQFLRQILRNLLSNISKYVPTQTEIRIEITEADASSLVCLLIQDAGPGIPANELPLLFEKFVRLQRDQRGSQSGSGLGLYICKQMVETMGGQIWAASSGKPGEGSRFYLTLPITSPEANAVKAASTFTTSSGRKRILSG